MNEEVFYKNSISISFSFDMKALNVNLNGIFKDLKQNVILFNKIKNVY